MIKIEEILKSKGVSKTEFAKMLNIIPQNVNRTIKRIEENQSEIDYILGLLKYDPKCSESQASNLDLTATNKNLSEVVKTQAEIIKKLTEKL